MANELNLSLDPSRTGLTVTATLILDNAAVGGASRSDHLTGRSTDVFCPSMNIWDFQRVVLSFWKFGGVGKGANKGFCHVSSDASYRVWDY